MAPGRRGARGRRLVVVSKRVSNDFGAGVLPSVRSTFVRAAAELIDESCWHMNNRSLRTSELAERPGRRVCIPRRNLSDVVCAVACAQEECALDAHPGGWLRLVLSARAHLDCFHPVASRWTQLAAHRARPRVDAHAFVRLALAFPRRTLARAARGACGACDACDAREMIGRCRPFEPSNSQRSARAWQCWKAGCTTNPHSR